MQLGCPTVSESNGPVCSSNCLVAHMCVFVRVSNYHVPAFTQVSCVFPRGAPLVYLLASVVCKLVFQVGTVSVSALPTPLHALYEDWIL